MRMWEKTAALAALVLTQIGCGGWGGGEGAMVRQLDDAGGTAFAESGADVVEEPVHDPPPDAGRDAADGRAEASAEAATAAEGGDDAAGDDGGAGEAGGEAGALAACVQAACDDANPGQGGANCGVLHATCGGQAVDCSAWQGAPDGGCSPSMPADYVCGGNGVPNQCGNRCESTAAYVNACADALLPSAWAVVQACSGQPYAIAGGAVTWRGQPATVGCAAYTCTYCTPQVALLCCD